MAESEVRFYGAFYSAYGMLMLRVARDAHPDPRAVKGLAGTLLLAGLARAGAWLTVGKPHPFQQALLALELTLPPLALLEIAEQ